jgi:tRNA(fMet)-specific endonuclease VapC
VRYLLDTNIISALMSDPQGPCALRVSQVPDNDLCTSEIVCGELHFGIEKMRALSPEKAGLLTSNYGHVFRRLIACPVDGRASFHYGRVHATLRRQGKMIGNNDMWIAGHALALSCVMVTDNVDEFERVPNLAVENWLRG